MLSRKFNPLELLRLKNELLEMYSNILTENEKTRALNDQHRKRAPRWCGITVHVTINCPFRCAYCYIGDMGFKFENPKPYPLDGKELLFALLNNKYFLPSRYGTLIAIGSISEPFIFPSKMLEYLDSLANLGNPIQFSTKQYISPSLANKIADISHDKKTPINPLITIITINKADLLEKLAPSPEKRFDSIKNLYDAGLKPVLFLRPIIPGITSNEVYEIVKKAKEAGAYGVVVGGLRVTRTILNRLRNLEFDVSEILRRMKIIDDKQRAVPFPEKRIIIQEIRKYGLIPWMSTCCANAWNAEVSCPSVCFIDGNCTGCSNACNFLRDSPDEELITEALRKLNIGDIIKGKFVYLDRKEKRSIEFLVRTLSRRGVKFVNLKRIKSFK